MTVLTNEPHRISVSLAHQPYEIVIGGEGLTGIGDELRQAGIKKGIKVLVVSNADVAEPYGELFLKSLIESGYDPKLLVLEAGEKRKNQSSIQLIHDEAYSAKLERGSLMIGLGGGVVGDMTGFAAATWLRGISVVQVPTTLLAMVDAAIGGKTGVNHPGGKNLIGSFHQPRLVLIDPKTLNTLPSREFRAGMAEVIKYGVISDPKLFNILETSPALNDLNALDEKLLEEILCRSASTKSNIVSLDEHEGGLRAILNYGHTFGHVVESLCGYGTWLHGEAVAIGMVVIGELALQRGSWSISDAKRQEALLKKAALPTKWPQLDPDKVLSSLEGDKKVQDGAIRFIMPTKIGAVEIRNDISREEIKECLLRLN